MIYVNVEAIRALSTEELRRAIAEDSMPVEQDFAMRAELDRRLADALYDAETNYNSETDDLLLAENAVLERLDLPPDHTEQGLTPWANQQVAAFVEEHRTK